MLIYLLFGFIPPDCVAKICDKLQSSAVVWTQSANVSYLCNLALAHEIYYQYYSVDHIFVIVQLSM